MTPTQKQMLKVLGNCGVYVPQDYNFGSKSKMLDRMVDAGLASKYVHGGYQITDAGRKALESK